VKYHLFRLAASGHPVDLEQASVVIGRRAAQAMCALTCAFVVCTGASAAGQVLPSEPVVLGDGVATVSGEVSGTIGPKDPGFFNYTDYEDSVLRLLRLDVTGSVRAGGHLTFLGELRSQNVHRPEAYALYARVRPWRDRRVEFQAGRIPPVFGAFARRTYASDNPLIGYPLAYQYLTSLRPDALPASADELLQMRGRGWLASYSIGDRSPAPGVPLVSAFRWDTGVQASAATDAVEGAIAVTVGTLANPVLPDDNTGRQVAGRAAVRPRPGLVLGVSAARGAFVSTDAARLATGASAPGHFDQTAWGADMEYARGYYLVRAEAVYSRWSLPTIGDPLRAFAAWVEGRYKIAPGVYAAGRVDHLGFSEISGLRRTATWDAPVTRVEAGVGYELRRNLLLKAAAQFTRRDGGRTRRANAVAAQAVWWF
jgi:hypothetical protein